MQSGTWALGHFQSSAAILRPLTILNCFCCFSQTTKLSFSAPNHLFSPSHLSFPYLTGWYLLFTTRCRYHFLPEVFSEGWVGDKGLCHVPVVTRAVVPLCSILFLLTCLPHRIIVFLSVGSQPYTHHVLPCILTKPGTKKGDSFKHLLNKCTRAGIVSSTFLVIIIAPQKILPGFFIIAS